MTPIDETKPTKSWLPQLKSKAWTVLLGLSLMLNLLVGGILLGGFYGKQRTERLAGASYVQLIPRKFFRDLPPQRRQQLIQIVKDNRESLIELRDAFEASSLKLADVLDQPNFALPDVQATVSEFAKGTENLAMRGGDVVVKIVSALSPEERKRLAQAIRDRDANRTKPKSN
jgi:uncharacterized membrane protein